jgi:ankyrin repeat protein
MLIAKLIAITLVLSLSVLAMEPRSGTTQAKSQSVANHSSPENHNLSTQDQAPAQDQEAAQDQEEQPVKKKKFTPASSLNEALYLASRADTDTAAYLDQAKGMLNQPQANVKATDPQGRTPLHWAVIGADYADSKSSPVYVDIAELLIAAGADVNVEDIYGNTPLDYQEFSTTQELMELLLEADAQNGDGQNEMAQLEKLVNNVTTAAEAGNINQVRAAVVTDLPLGTVIPVNISTLVSSSQSRAGDPFGAEVSAPVITNGRTVIAPRTKIEGTVLYASKSPNRYERSQLVLHFANLVNPDGSRTHLPLRLLDIPNAREKVQSNRIIGVSYPNNALNQKKVSWGTRIVGVAFPAFGYGMEAATLVYGKKFNREIRFDPGTGMTLQVRVPSEIKVAPDTKGWPTFNPSPDLVKLVEAQPQRVDTRQGAPVDVTNVMLIGSQANVDAVFRAAGWDDVAALGVKSGLKTFQAVLFKQGYDRAPFSDLFLKGRAPDLTFQKQLNTFAKRDHIRIWKVGTYEGKDVWLGAATHDIGMGVDRKGVKPQWYHTVDTQVDRERSRVMNDLMLTGNVKGCSLVERPNMPKENKTPAGNARNTDGRMLVLDLAT